MKKHVYSLITLMSLSMLPLASAHADGLGDMAIQPYMGVGLGAFGVEYKDTAVSQKNTTFGGYIKGGADIGDYFGLELRLGMTSSGSKTYAAGTLGTAAGTLKAKDDYFLSYLLKLQVPATAEIKPYALLGGTTAKFKVDNTSTSTSASKSKTGFTYGFGLNYDLGSQFSANVEWVQYWTNVKLGSTFASRASGATDPKAKLWGASASLEYHF